MSYNYRITVFTPTYNRAYILQKLYNSLCFQTFTNFEWLIVDDGSSDNTKNIVEEWIEENKINISYYKTENGGKHRAINRGLELSNGEIFFAVDSDDELTDDALSKIDKWFCEIDNDKKIKGIIANKGLSAQHTVNGIFKADYLDKSFFDMKIYLENKEYVLDGERAIAFYTDFHKKYMYPEFEEEKFMTEAVVYNRMAYDGYDMRFYNDIICIYEYQEDGLTKAGNAIFVNNPRGYGLWLKEKAKFEMYSFIKTIKMYYSFTCEMSSKYDSEVIAECIDTSKVYIVILKLVHKIKKRILG